MAIKRLKIPISGMNTPFKQVFFNLSDDKLRGKPESSIKNAEKF